MRHAFALIAALALAGCGDKFGALADFLDSSTVEICTNLGGSVDIASTARTAFRTAAEVVNEIGAANCSGWRP